MARRDEGILDLLAEAPWVMSVIVSAAAFLTLRYILPAVYGENFMAKFLGRTAQPLAPWISLLLLLPVPFSLYNAWRKRKPIDNQKDLSGIRSLSWKEYLKMVYECLERCTSFFTAVPEGGSSRTFWRLMKP